MKRILPVIAAGLGLGLVLSGLHAKPSQAMPPFAQALGVNCDTCHTMVPMLNAYGRYVQSTAYSAIDHDQLVKEFPAWIDYSVESDYGPGAGAGTGVARNSFGNLSIHALGYLSPDITYHFQDWLISGDSTANVLDTFWVSYNKLFQRQGHLFVGLLEAPAPSVYSMSMDLDGPGASSTLVGEHDWSYTIGNRWGTKLAYIHNWLNLEGGYLLSDDPNFHGLTDFGGAYGSANCPNGNEYCYFDNSNTEKTFAWKAAYASPKKPVEAGLFGSFGTIQVSTGTDQYNSVAAYVQVDPGKHYVPGVLAIYQTGHDSNPGVSSISGNVMPATDSTGSSFELFEPIFRGNAVVSLRHDFNGNNYDGQMFNGNYLNVGFNIPGVRYLHGYVEALMGGASELAGDTGAPTFKSMLWLALPVERAK
ncbi:MAG TPA: hypothetical protein VNJ51_11530 [Candidatus Dormibacteraeota bacterium]|nr:hypothetical protein [Candidatus Dormibacteraeota bacterium]